MTQCLLDRPAAQAWPTTREWITEFLRSGGDHWDREAAIAMTSEAHFSALAHADRPACMTARRDGKAAQVRVHAHTSTLPKTEWMAGSPLVEELLPRLRHRTRHCGAEVRITLEGAEMVIWFRLLRKARGVGRLFTKSRPSPDAWPSRFGDGSTPPGGDGASADPWWDCCTRRRTSSTAFR